ncbi:MAG: cyclic nucleotide-binding domain-containing protein [Opitutae bacterium]|jgi:signal transduction histidine kinase|nr:cyclic nucleotide-binding domain-containing protein [Opitutae bacterium]
MKLEKHPFIQSISEGRRDAILGQVELLKIKQGDTIFREGSRSDSLYVILEGLVAFTKVRPDGPNQSVSTSGEGSFFGEVGVFTGEQRALDARAKSDCTLGRIPENTVKKIIEDAAPQKKILDSVIKHLKSTTSLYIEEVTRKEKLALVGTMISSILHDFKNPFSIISLGSHIIQQRQGENDPTTAKICTDIEAQIRRMLDMANDLAAFARGGGEIEIAHITMGQLFEHFRELNAPFFQHNDVTVEMHPNNVSLQADASKLLRVLQNLVGNAIDAIHQTEKPGTIAITAIDKGDTIHLSISDNGPGIPDKIQSRFFEPFVTFDKSGGTGLGTAIVRSIVDAHHGNIIFATSSSGTTFTIQFPKEHKNSLGQPVTSACRQQTSHKTLTSSPPQSTDDSVWTGH